jgi:hypothetical protein
MTPGEVLLDPKPRGLAAEQALQIARLDAEAAYGDLDDFRITSPVKPMAGTSTMSCWTRRVKAAALTMSSMPGPGRSCQTL